MKRKKDSHQAERNNIEGYIKTPELRRRLGLSKRVVARWIHEGILPAIRPPGGRAFIFEWRTVREALAKFQVTTKTV
ncbi:MAG: hypothetical protein JNN07_18510 [Verrucomicrobiales bacterium]|nr:hypothetical protein [Verrucomicrobiales bacterium]